MENQAAIEKIQSIVAIEAVELSNGKFRTEAVFADGTREVLKKAGNKPVSVQAYNFKMNGNIRRSAKGVAAYFTFSKTIDSYFASRHLKTFAVA